MLCWSRRLTNLKDSRTISWSLFIVQTPCVPYGIFCFVFCKKGGRVGISISSAWATAGSITMPPAPHLVGVALVCLGCLLRRFTLSTSLFFSFLDDVCLFGYASLGVVGVLVGVEPTHRRVRTMILDLHLDNPCVFVSCF